MEKVIKPIRKNGFQKGVSGNANGRPVGAKNAVPSEIKLKAINYINSNFDTFVEAMDRIEDPIQKSKLFLDTCKTFLPRPKPEEEVEEENIFKSELMSRLFQTTE
jgi:hypothetical protein